MNKLAALIGACFMVAVGAAVATAGGDDHKTTICHAAGLADTTQYVTITIDEHAVYGPAGHFYENGTPQAGHEQDYFGPCEGDTTTTTDTTPTDTTPTTTTSPPPPPPPPTTTTTVTTPPGPRCPPGMTPTAGKDGAPGNQECEFPPATTTPAVAPPVAAPPAAPAAVTTTTTTTTTAPPAAAPAKPATAPKKPQAAKPAPKPTSKPKPAKPTQHVCLPLKDGTQRAWWKGGNGMNAGCYPVIQGSG